jgi:hypothetical protein
VSHISDVTYLVFLVFTRKCYIFFVNYFPFVFGLRINFLNFLKCIKLSALLG